MQKYNRLVQAQSCAANGITEAIDLVEKLVYYCEMVSEKPEKQDDLSGLLTWYHYLVLHLPQEDQNRLKAETLVPSDRLPRKKNARGNGEGRNKNKATKSEARPDVKPGTSTSIVAMTKMTQVAAVLVIR